MIHVEVQQILDPLRLDIREKQKYRVIERITCACTLNHAQDGEFPAYREVIELEMPWTAALIVLHEEYGDEISSVEVRA